jgi:hypothetical protein
MNHSQAIALEELQQKPIEQIQRETALTWAFRAWAAKQLGLDRDYDSYRDEAIEHAALSGDDELLHAVRAIVAG